jgi:hypothetical protein
VGIALDGGEEAGAEIKAWVRLQRISIESVEFVKKLGPSS